MFVHFKCARGVLMDASWIYCLSIWLLYGETGALIKNVILFALLLVHHFPFVTAKRAYAHTKGSTIYIHTEGRRREEFIQTSIFRHRSGHNVTLYLHTHTHASSLLYEIYSTSYYAIFSSLTHKHTISNISKGYGILFGYRHSDT